MKNPWKGISKINPQREDGTRQINSDVLSALIKAKLPTSEMSVVLTIISKTWGFNKQYDAISTSQFVDETGFSSRSIKEARANLIKKRIIYFESSERVKRGSPLNQYLFNKHYDTWININSKKGEADFTGEVQRKKRVKHTTPTIESITIESIIVPQNEKNNETVCRVITYLNRKTGSKFKPETKATKQHINARLKEGFTPEDFKTVIDFKCSQWLYDANMQEYLRPKTLFSSNFEGYLNAAVRNPEHKEQKITVFKVECDE